MGAPTQNNNGERRSRSRSPRSRSPRNKNDDMGMNDYFKNQDYWRSKREAASKAKDQASRPYETRTAHQIEDEYRRNYQEERFKKVSKQPP